jgi:putative membrane protein
MVRAYLSKSLILLGFSVFLFYLSFSGQIRMFINPRFAVLNEITAVILLAMFAVQICAPWTGDGDHGHQPRRWVYAIFTVPLALAVLLPGTVLGTGVAANRGLNLNGGSGIPDQANVTGISQSGPIQVTADNFVRVVDALGQSPESYAGRKIDMLGFVMRQQDLTSREFGLIRFVISHCTADAIPGGLIVESGDTGAFRDGTWIEVEGVIRLGNYEQQVVPVIEATSIKRDDQPQDPYVYP